MENRNGKQGQEKNAGVIIERLREESAREAGKVTERAQREAEAIVAAAHAQAGGRRERAFAQLRDEQEKARERLLSGINLEKKRIELDEKSAFIRDVLAAVGRIAEGFREKPGYRDFLAAAVAEGAGVIGSPAFEAVYAAPDEKLFRTGEFVLRLENACRGVIGKTVTITYTKGDFAEPGALIRSLDGRILFDNRFSRRLERLEDEIRARLLKEY